MNSLYNITNEFLELQEKAKEGVITEEEYDREGQLLAMDLQQKHTNIIGYVQDRMALIDAIDVQIKRLQEFKKVEQNGLDRLKENTKTQMERLGLTKVETELGTLSIAKNPISVEIVNEEELPKQFVQEVVTIKPDKKAIADNFKATGEIPPGVVIHDNNTSLRVK